jgi:alpha-D-xyloside xylohydrolase
MINLTAPITRIVCSANAAFTPKSRVIIEPIQPQTTQTASSTLQFTSGGKVLLTQTSWTLTPKEIYRNTVPHGNAIISKQMTVDGERSVVENAEFIKTGDAYEAEITFAVPKNNRIFGLGQHEDGVYDYRGKSEYLYQNNMKIPMPVFLSVGSAGNFAVVFDAGCMMTFAENGGEVRLTFDAADCIDYYVITGADMDGLVHWIRKLTGTAPMLPRWAFGYMQSKERYKTQNEVIETAAKFKELRIPISCIIQDWSTWENKKWGNKRVDKERYPDIKKMIAELHEMDVAFMVSIWPNPSVGSEDNNELAEIGGVLSNATTYDAFNEKAREIYWKQCEREWFSAGADAWWCDSTEPFTPDWNGADIRSGKERYELAKEKFTAHIDARETNLYALEHARGIYEHQRRRSDKRVVNLTRAGYLGIQRYGVILWSGDICSTWNILRRQIAEGLNICASGIPYWSVDIGAFFVGSDTCWQNWHGGKTDKPTPWFWKGDYENGVADDGYKELYTRWLQWGTFLPIMRSHGTDTPREPWHFGEAGSVYYDTIVKYINLRHRLLPYTYSLAAMVTRNGYTPMRNLCFDFPGDETAVDISDAYMFGKAFLVCPVTEPGAVTRDVYLPAGGWYDFAKKTYIEGGRHISAPTDITSIPVYVRAGSIVPVSSNGGGTADTLEIYAGADGEFTVYFDDGNGYGYENGNFAAVTVRWDDAAQTLTTVNVEGLYPYPQKFDVVIFKSI